MLVDSFMNYSWAFPTRNQQASTVAKLLWEKILVNFRFSQRLHSDQGCNFESRILKDSCKVARIKKTRTNLYHTQGNGQTEWFNRTLLGMLGTLDADEKNHWPEYVLPLVHAYNCIRHSSTGYSPYFLLFGHTLHFSINVSLGVTFENGIYTVNAENLCTCLHYAHDLVVQNAQKRWSLKKRYHAHTSPGVLLAHERRTSSRTGGKMYRTL